MEMKDRIKMIMDAENMTPARFADTLQIGRAVISHILNGRNNPSLDVITRILTQMADINSEWLLTGIGNMYKSDKTESTPQEVLSNNSYPDLFSQPSFENSVKPSTPSSETEYRKENIVNSAVNTPNTPVNERIIYRETKDKKIKQIIIYYTDNTFETFNSPQN